MNVEQRFMRLAFNYQFYLSYAPNVLGIANIKLIPGFNILDLLLVLPLFIGFNPFLVPLQVFLLPRVSLGGHYVFDNLINEL